MAHRTVAIAAGDLERMVVARSSPRSLRIRGTCGWRAIVKFVGNAKRN